MTRRYLSKQILNKMKAIQGGMIQLLRRGNNR